MGWVYLALVALVATGCSKDKPRPTVGPATSSEKSAAAGPATTATSTSATTTTGPAPCVAAGTAGPLRASQVTGDVDGDGTPDTVTVYATGSPDAPAPYVIRVDLGAGKGALDATIADTANDPAQVVKVLGTAEISAGVDPPDGSGAETFVTVGSGAAATIVTVFQVTGCRLTRLTGPNSVAPSTFTVGGTVTSLGGLRCDSATGSPRLVGLTAESDDGVTYRTTEQRLRPENGAFVADTPPVTGTIAASDPGLQAFDHLDCPGIEPV